MKKRDFEFVGQRRQHSARKTKEKTARDRRPRRNLTLAPSKNSWLAENNGDRFLQIIERASQIKLRREMLQLLQGEDIQHWIPHQILVSAWGELDGRHLRHDVVSAIPGMRSGLRGCCAIDHDLQDLAGRWHLQGRQPLLLDSATDKGLAKSACGCVLHNLLKGTWSLLVHGVIDVRDNNVCIYLALNADSTGNRRSIEHRHALIDPLITQIDLAYRRIATLTFPMPAKREFCSATPALSARENQILMAVSRGKTNAEISNSLAISANTVKNHLQRLMKKLDAGNRTEAVAKHRQMDTGSQSNQVTRSTSNDLIFQQNA